jgi:hypothetical protein
MVYIKRMSSLIIIVALLIHGGVLCILGFIVSWGVLLYLGFYCIMGDYFVSWVLDGGFYCVLFYYGGYFVSWVFVGGFLLYLGFHVGFGCCGYVVSYGFFMWAS